ncbi:MAG: hypothetical protein C0469_06685 [Cyanobacteria bacterium DS2.3.42]|nr:hypothetical protein [Cyanobacteria bacterium DS2.3.42]
MRKFRHNILLSNFISPTLPLFNRKRRGCAGGNKIKTLSVSINGSEPASGIKLTKKPSEESFEELALQFVEPLYRLGRHH